MKLKETLIVTKNVLKEKNYLILFVILFISTSLLFYYLADVVDLFLNNPLSFITLTLTLSFLIAVFSALNLTLIVYEFRNSKLLGYKEGSAGVGGAFVGAAASGCPVCGSAVLGLFGFSTGLSVLPFKGIELKLLGLGLLLVSIYLITAKINKKCSLCKAKKHEKRGSE